jgi:hypothetical protein
MTLTEASLSQYTKTFFPPNCFPQIFIAMDIVKFSILLIFGGLFKAWWKYQKNQLAIVATRKQAKENMCIAIYIYIYIYYYITINKNTKINIIFGY